MKILIVDDSTLNRVVMKDIMSKFGVCDTVINGRDCIDRFTKAWAQNEPYNLICLDIVMPEMDGYEVVRAIRKWEQEKQINKAFRVKVIMISGLNDQKSVLEAKGYCDDYILKPVDKALMRTKLRSLGLL